MLYVHLHIHTNTLLADHLYFKLYDDTIVLDIIFLISEISLHSFANTFIK